jgi:membrane protease YdiL (CAAX protease family)
MHGIGKLDHEGRHEHVPGEEKSVQSREQSQDQKDSAEEFAVSGGVTEESGDAVGGKTLREGRDSARPEDLAEPVRDKDQPARNAQHERRGITLPPTHFVELLAPIALFVSTYLATFLTLGYGAAAIGLPYHQWIALISAVSATAFTVRIIERGRWRLGIFVPPRIAWTDLLLGAVFATILILMADIFVMLSSNLRHTRGDGFPWFELVTMFAPAAIHEEIAFRGYLFQKMRQWNRWGAIAGTSLLFAALHGGNRGIAPMPMVNLIIAGVLLALAYERYQRLWFPIGIHFVWNVLSGPILGYGVSGYVANSTVFRTVGSGYPLLTGGAFGIEGSVWMGVVEVGGIFWLLNELRISNDEFRMKKTS